MVAAQHRHSAYSTHNTFLLTNTQKPLLGATLLFIPPTTYLLNQPRLL